MVPQAWPEVMPGVEAVAVAVPCCCRRSPGPQEVVMLVFRHFRQPVLPLPGPAPPPSGLDLPSCPPKDWPQNMPLWSADMTTDKVPLVARPARPMVEVAALSRMAAATAALSRTAAATAALSRTAAATVTDKVQLVAGPARPMGKRPAGPMPPGVSPMAEVAALSCTAAATAALSRTAAATVTDKMQLVPGPARPMGAEPA